VDLDPHTLRLAVPSKGRLMEPAFSLLKDAGVHFRRNERALAAHAKGLDLLLLFVRPDDIPVLVAEGAADLGIVGRDLVVERGCTRKVQETLRLDFGYCRLAIAAPIKGRLKTPADLAGKKIVTSMVNTTKQYLRRHKVKAEVVEVSGSVEIMVALGLADAIVDLVETGDTLRANGLDVVETIAETEAILISAPQPRDPALVKRLVRRFEGVLTARRYTLVEYNLHVSKLKEAEKIAPGYDSPTVSQTEDPDVVAVRVMVPRKQSIEVMDGLEALGASAIMETAIEHCRL
jgi:ATP phosphoribosyltransferase